MTSHFFAFNEIKGVSAGSADPFYPASNLLEAPTYLEFRSTLTTDSLVFDLQNVVPVDSVLLCGSNVSGELQFTTITIEANTTNSWSAPAYSSSHEVTLDEQLHNLVYLSFDKKMFRYWRIVLENPTGSFVGLSNIFIGSRIELPVDLGYSFSMVGKSDVSKGRYGQRFIDKLPDLRAFTASMSVMNQAERDSLASIVHFCSTHKPIWMVLSPGESLMEAGYFYFTKTPEFENQAYHIYNTSFELEEVV